MTRKLFGTDGIRGVANSELTPELAFALGRAVVATLPSAPTTAGVNGDGKRPSILVGRDTRRSGEMLEGALVAGITSAGADALLAGIVPTPAVALLLRELNCDGGVVISASHNPPEYNGLKVFSAEGFKLPDAREAAIEAMLLDTTSQDNTPRPTGTRLGRVVVLPDAAERYVAHLTGLFAPNALLGLRVALDCGHGAAALTTPAAFRQLGAQVTALNTSFDGDDINVNCGSTHMEQLEECVQSGDFDLGIANDGDADRMLATDETGALLDGDHVIALCAQHLLDAGKLVGLDGRPTVVATVMANLGFTRALEALGITVEHTQVGDRYVLERMRETGAVLGGEQSGHIIFLEHNTTGDGLLAALMLAHIVHTGDKRVSELAQVMTAYPQAQRNLRVTSKDVAGNTTVQAAVTAAETELGDTGRVLVRASGTEPLVRVMVEATDIVQANRLADALAATIEKELG